MVKTLFVDTNVFLSLYAFSDDDIEQFRNLFILAQEGEIDFLLPQQVIDEFWRNREAKIAESLNSLKAKVNLHLPAPIRELDESVDLIKAQKNFDVKRQALIKVFLDKAADHKLKADELIEEIFEKSTKIPVTPEILERSKNRLTIGNPPGKGGSHGDAINWECIKSKLAIFDDLYFVSRDSDYSSRLHEGKFNEFLARELMEDQLSGIRYFDSLRRFMESEFPKVQIDAFTEALEAVQSLESSGSFASTHGAISRLMACESFSNNLVKRLIVAAEDNSQVGAIIGDADLFEFYEILLDSYGGGLEPSWKSRLEELVVFEKETNETEWDEVPF